MSYPEPDTRHARSRPEPARAPVRGRAATRQRLVEAGTALFARRGLHGVTSTQIAQQAGVATGTFYLHFRDKAELFHAIVFEALGQLRARQDRAGAPHPRGSLAELRARTEELLRFAEDNRDLIRVLFGRGGESATVGEEVLDQIVPGIERSLEQRRAAGQAPNDLHPTVAAQALAALVVRVLAWWSEHPERATREQVLHTILRMHPSQLGREAR
jgi:AcrR family transcriptional regulator